METGNIHLINNMRFKNQPKKNPKKFKISKKLNNFFNMNAKTYAKFMLETLIRNFPHFDKEFVDLMLSIKQIVD